VTRSRRKSVIDRWGRGYLLHKGGDGAEVPAEGKLDRLQQDPRCCVGHDRLWTHRARFLAAPPRKCLSENIFGPLLWGLWCSLQRGPGVRGPSGPINPGSHRQGRGRGGVSTLKTNPASLGGNGEKRGLALAFVGKGGMGAERVGSKIWGPCTEGRKYHGFPCVLVQAGSRGVMQHMGVHSFTPLSYVSELFH